ncbi:MAG: hypothetical protein ILO68_02470, partial [Clostridia bacterium]|nr:hypothetical protein [Clostridia bacterium]
MKKGIVILLISAVLAAFVSCAQEHVHDFSREIVTREPSCVSEGEKQLVCACGETKSFAIPAIGHSWGEWVETKPATCSVPGSRERV